MLTFSRRLFFLTFLEGAGVDFLVNAFSCAFFRGGRVSKVSYIDFHRNFPGGRGAGGRGGAGGEGGLLILNNFFIFKYFFHSTVAPNCD